MKRASLARRIFRIIFAIGAINVFVTMVAIEFIYEDVEDTIFSLEMAEERAFIERRITEPVPQAWHTALLSALYVPDGATDVELPHLFRNRPVPFSAEVMDGEKSYLISIDRTASPPGVLYMAQDISIFEDREDFMQLAITLLCGGMLLLGLLLAWQGTQRAIWPLHALTGEIRRIEPGSRISRVEDGYRDAELADIARTLNELLGALDEYVRREKALVSLASHELRTPVAVIAGALDVLEQRGSLGDADRRTLARIRRATDEMRSDVDTLLKLARRGDPNPERGPVNLAHCVAEVVADVEACTPEARSRLAWTSPEPPVSVRADPALVRMLLRNLIQNAVRHTRGNVEIDIAPERLCIRDHGEGLPERARVRLDADRAPSIPEDGLGLFIVRLICERLGWTIRAEAEPGSGTIVELDFPRAAHAPAGPRVAS